MQSPPRLQFLPAIALLACSAPRALGPRSHFPVETELAALAPEQRECAAALTRAAAQFPSSWPATDPSWSERAAAELLVAAAAAPDRALGEHLAEAQRALLTGDAGALDASALTLGASAFVAPFFEAATSAEKPEPVRALQFGVIVEDDQRRLTYFLERLAEFEDWLGWEGAGPRATRAQLVVAEAIERVGDVPPGSMHTRIPADRTRRAEIGSLDVFWKTMLRERWFHCEVEPAAIAALGPRDAARVTANGHLNFYATRYGTYQLGPQRVGEQTLQEYFGEAWGPTVIVKADLLGTLVHEWLIEEDAQAAAMSEENLAALVATSFRAAADVKRGDAPSAHGSASGWILVRSRQAGAITFGRDGRWSIDYDALRRVSRELALEVLDIHARGDLEAARELVVRGEALDPELAATVARVAEIELVDRTPVFVVRE